MSSLLKEDLEKKLFGPRRQRLHEFIEVEGAGAQRYYLCAAASPSSCMKGILFFHKTVDKPWKKVKLKCNAIQEFPQPSTGMPKKECLVLWCQNAPARCKRLLDDNLGYQITWECVLPCSHQWLDVLDIVQALVPFTLSLLQKTSLLLSTQVTKNKEVEICMVKHWRVDREEKYEIVEKWFLKDLEMIDGKEADADNPHFEMHFHKVYNMEAYSCASKYTFARTLKRLNAMYLKKEFKIVNFDDTYLNDDSIWSSSNRDFLVLMRICFYASNLLCLSLCRLS